HRGDARIPDEDVDAERWFLGVGDHERAAERQLPYGGGALLAEPTERANEVGRMARPSLALASHRITARIGGRQRQRQQNDQRQSRDAAAHVPEQSSALSLGTSNRGGWEKSKAPSSGDAWASRSVSGLSPWRSSMNFRTDENS